MSTKTREIAETVKEFNLTISELLKNVEALLNHETAKANVDRLRSRISVFKQSVGPSEPLSLAHPFFIKYKNQIKSRDEDFFMEMDAREVANEHKKLTQKDEFIFDLVDNIKASYVKATVSEKDALYGGVYTLLKCSIEWVLHCRAQKAK